MLFSILIPVRDDRANLLCSLGALKGEDLSGCEILICDDGSNPPLTPDDLKPLGPEFQLFRLDGCGPAAARNFLAKRARGKYLFFLDADAQPLKGMLCCARKLIAENPNVQAFFGCYDDAPDSSSLISLHKNFSHHFVHQRAAGVVSTFWCGCGVILRELYLQAGGLSESYRKPSIEDIELGMRLTNQGVTIHLFPQLQVRHLKHWTFRNWLYTDLFLRGIPWVRLMRSRGTWLNELNFTRRARLSSMAVVTFLSALGASPWWPWLAPTACLALAGFALLNAQFFRVVAQKYGAPTSSAMVLLHLIYTIVCILAFLVGMLSPSLKPDDLPRLGFDQSRKAPAPGKA